MTTTYFVQASLGSHFADYYIDAKSADAAAKLARQQYAQEFKVQRGIIGFIQIAF